MTILRSAAVACGLALASLTAQADKGLVEIQVEGSRPIVDTAAYPSMALRRRVEGQVLVSFTINTDGKAENIAILAAQPSGFFDEATLAAVRNATYEVSRVDGRPAVNQDVKKRFVYLIDETLQDDLES